MSTCYVSLQVWLPMISFNHDNGLAPIDVAHQIDESKRELA